MMRWDRFLTVLLAGLLSSPVWAQSGTIVSVTNGDTAGLIGAINTLNTAGGGFILLAPNGSYTVSAPSDWWYGPDAFPAIQSSIFIDDNGSTITRAAGSPNFRFFCCRGDAANAATALFGHAGAVEV